MANIEMLLKEKVYASKDGSTLYLTEYIEVYRIISDGLELYEIIDRSEMNEPFSDFLEYFGSGDTIPEAFRDAINKVSDIIDKFDIVKAEAKYYELHPEIFNKYDEHQLLLDLDYYETSSKLNNKRMDKECED